VNLPLHFDVSPVCDAPDGEVGRSDDASGRFHFPSREEPSMPRPDYTDITFVLDRSGSMASVKDATIEAFNGFLHSQRSGDGAATMSLIQFDDQYELVYAVQPIARAPELSRRTFKPRGSTALLDAIGRTIVETGQRYAAMPEHERPGTVVFVTLTDGFENSSQDYTMRRVNDAIAEQRDRYAWQFVFLAANQDAIATAAGMGIAAGQALTFAATNGGAAGCFNALDRNMHKLRKARASGMSKAAFEFADEDRAEAAEAKKS
jgi:hypothetical protein